MRPMSPQTAGLGGVTPDISSHRSRPPERRWAPTLQTQFPRRPAAPFSDRGGLLALSAPGLKADRRRR
jgi:hypothetical protein